MHRARWSILVGRADQFDGADSTGPASCDKRRFRRHRCMRVIGSVIVGGRRGPASRRRFGSVLLQYADINLDVKLHGRIGQSSRAEVGGSNRVRSLMPDAVKGMPLPTLAERGNENIGATAWFTTRKGRRLGSPGELIIMNAIGFVVDLHKEVADVGAGLFLVCLAFADAPVRRTVRCRRMGDTRKIASLSSSQN